MSCSKNTGRTFTTGIIVMLNILISNIGRAAEYCVELISTNEKVKAVYVSETNSLIIPPLTRARILTDSSDTGQGWRSITYSPIDKTRKVIVDFDSKNEHFVLKEELSPQTGDTSHESRQLLLSRMEGTLESPPDLPSPKYPCSLPRHQRAQKKSPTTLQET